jgi:hypothetical protein
VRENDIDFQPNELGCELGEAFAPPLRPAIFNRHSASIDPAELAQSLAKSSGPFALGRGRIGAQEPDGRQPARLLRPCHERPSYYSAAKQADELTPFQLIELHPIPRGPRTA